MSTTKIESVDLEHGALRVLDMLRNEAPKMELYKALEFVKEYQEMRNDLQKYEYIIMMLLELIGINDSGNLRDKQMAEKLKDMPDEIWDVLNIASRTHAGYACSPFTPKDWKEKCRQKFGSKKEDIEWYKKSQLSILKTE